MKLEGEKQVRAELEKLARQYPEAAKVGLYQEALGIYREAVQRAPWEHTVLRNSAYVAPPRQDGRDLVVEIGFGTKYAHRQHEETTWNHPRGGEAKYLQHAMEVRFPGLLQRLAARIKQAAAQGQRFAGGEVNPRPIVLAIGDDGKPIIPKPKPKGRKRKK